MLDFFHGHASKIIVMPSNLNPDKKDAAHERAEQRARNMKLFPVFLILAALQPSAIHHHVPEEVSLQETESTPCGSSTTWVASFRAISLSLV